MFNNISWSDYLTFITVSLLIWYAFVLYSYYRHDILNGAKIKQPVPDPAMNFTYVPLKEQVPSANHEDYQPKATEKDTSHIVQSFAGEVEEYFEQTGKNQIAKDVLLQQLTIIAGKYLSLANSEYRVSLDQFIINQAEVNCAVLLNENEVGVIWSGT